MKRHDQNTSHARPTCGYKPLAAALMLAGLAHAGTAQADLTAGTVLQYTAGYTTCTAYNAKGKCIATDTLGTYFTMDTNGDGTVQASEKTAFAPGPDGGIVMGVTQDTNGHTSHTGAPHAGAGGIDAEWGFFSNAGMVYTSVAIADQTGSGATRSLDFRGWTVTWNGIPTIPMGGDVANFPGDTRLATIVCSSANCANGDTFTLTYAAHVPLGDVSGFGGVYYTISMPGTIVIGEPAGTTATAKVPNSTPPTDSAMSRQCVGGCFDFTESLTTGSWLYVVLRLNEAIPEGAVYRKYINGSWTTFTTGAAGTIKSAPGTGTDGSPATCPASGDAAYTSGLTAGNRCIRLGIKDGGANDSDGSANSSVTDPGGVGVPAANVTDISYSKTTSGCSLTGSRINPTERGDWWIVAGFLAWLGALRMRFKRQTQS